MYVYACIMYVYMRVCVQDLALHLVVPFQVFYQAPYIATLVYCVLTTLYIVVCTILQH